MKKILLLTGALLALTASLALAAPGLNIRWVGATAASYCPLASSSVLDASDPCDANDGAHGFAMSFSAPPGLSKVISESFIVDVQTADPVLPQWWHLEDRNDALGIPAGCRGHDPGPPNAPSSFDVNTSRSIGIVGSCKDYWAGAQSGGFVWTPKANRTRLFAVFAIGSAAAGPLTTDAQYWAGTGILDTNHAIADPLADPPVQPCGGCLVPACIVWNWLVLQQPTGTPNGDIEVTQPGVKGQFMTWQGGVVGGSGCPAATPTRKATWGQVKSLYR